MVCDSFVCIYSSQCVAYEVQGTDACCNGNDECVNFHCQACENTYCSIFFLPEADDLEVEL